MCVNCKNNTCSGCTETCPPGPIGLTGIQGPTGPVGDQPAYEWNGTQIRFENPDGSWGQYVNLVLILVARTYYLVLVSVSLS